mmetsp:Transcript_17873/g.36301  ORF Transcript_17873/g.36301 Transcript_17873/m.36301 type:complete len:100 (+) Transcript_17873:317-616(+)
MPVKERKKRKKKANHKHPRHLIGPILFETGKENKDGGVRHSLREFSGLVGVSVPLGAFPAFIPFSADQRQDKGDDSWQRKEGRKEGRGLSAALVFFLSR